MRAARSVNLQLKAAGLQNSDYLLVKVDLLRRYRRPVQHKHVQIRNVYFKFIVTVGAGCYQRSVGERVWFSESIGLELTLNGGQAAANGKVLIERVRLISRCVCVGGLVGRGIHWSTDDTQSAHHLAIGAVAKSTIIAQ